MNGTPSRDVISLILLAVEKIMSRFSTTHGPAISTKGLPPPTEIDEIVTVFISFH